MQHFFRLTISSLEMQMRSGEKLQNKRSCSLCLCKSGDVRELAGATASVGTRVCQGHVMNYFR